MPAANNTNTAPIFTAVPDIQWGSYDGNSGSLGTLRTSNIRMDGTGNVLTVFTANSGSGGFVQKIRFQASGSNVASVARIFLNNGLDSGSVVNNVLIDEVALPATTLSQTAVMPPQERILNLPMPPNYKLQVTLGTSVAAGYWVSVYGGKY